MRNVHVDAHDERLLQHGGAPRRPPANPEAGVHPTDRGASVSGTEAPFGTPLSMTPHLGAGTLSVSGVTVASGDTADFTLAGTTCLAGPLEMNDSCTTSVRVRPSAAGLRSAQLVVATNTVEGSTTIALPGTGAP